MLDTYGIIKALRLITGASDLTTFAPCYTIQTPALLACDESQQPSRRNRAGFVLEANMNVDLNEFGVYIIENTATGCVYVGSTSGSFAFRLGEHKRSLDRGTHVIKRMQQDWHQYGADMFTFRSLEVCTTSEQAATREMEWIAAYAPNVYNYQSSICPHCTASLTMGQYGMAVRRGYCGICKPNSIRGRRPLPTPALSARAYECPNCGSELSLGAYGAAVRHGTCKACKEGTQ